MNRIILVGNGFDLAHNLRTSYKDFMDWYWGQWRIRLKTSHRRVENDGLCTFGLNSHSYNWSTYYQHNLYFIESYENKEFIDEIRTRTGCSIQFTPLMERIVTTLKISNWVDIENEYYQLLIDTNTYPVTELNNELDNIRNKLIEYLTTLSKPNINLQFKNLIQAPILKDDIAITSLTTWKDFVNERLKYDQRKWNHLLHKYDIPLFDHSCDYDYAQRVGLPQKAEYSMDEIDIIPLNTSKSALIPNSIMLLNFNYTTIADDYISKVGDFPIVHIHGELSNPGSVIFGYGDEMDDGYEALKKKNDNEYLKHMKTPRYLETDNYRRVLTFIEASPYQVFIMGHSCGNSDRTLLNRIFEHPNCVSIKPFYHKEKDNYLDIVQNISRNFTDAHKMRDRVVNKMYCQPLPQISIEQEAENV